MTTTTIVLIAIAYVVLALLAWSIFHVGARNDTSRYGTDDYAEADRAASLAEMTPLHDRSSTL